MDYLHWDGIIFFGTYNHPKRIFTQGNMLIQNYEKKYIQNYAAAVLRKLIFLIIFMTENLF